MSSPDEFQNALQGAQARIASHTGYLFEVPQVVPIVRSTYTYRNLSDEDLEQYVRFLESEAGRWYERIGTQAVKAAMAAVEQRFKAKLPLSEQKATEQSTQQ